MRLPIVMLFIFCFWFWVKSMQRRFDYYSGYSFNNLPNILKKDIIFSFIGSVLFLILLILV